MLSENIKKLRKENKLTQKQLAEMTGISTSYLQQLELGQKENPSIDVLEKIAKVLDVQIGYLLGKSEYKTLDSQIIKNDILNIIEKTDAKDNDFSKLIRSTIDTSFLTINDFTDGENIEALKIIHDLYKNIWNIKTICKNKKLYKIVSLPELDKSLNSFNKLKKENSILLDNLYKTLSKESE